MNILDKLVAKNESPILFIGSGISRRYVSNFPNWEQLLLRLWEKTGATEDEFYRKLIEINNGLPNDVNANTKSFIANIKIASLIQKSYNDGFMSGKIQINGFSARDAYQSMISPFKKEVSNCFKDLSLLEEKRVEIESFKKLLLSSRAIITTNYDTLTEDLVGDDFKIYKHQADMFLSHMDCGEIYKVHGCISDPNNIVLTEDDYKRFDRNSVLITAKLISFFMESPIIFLGYSISDQNISRILQSFAESLRVEQRSILQERIIYLNYKEGESTINEYQIESDALGGAHFTVIETDNYKSVYDTLSRIDQGLPVAYVRKFKEHIRKLIIARGKEGSLKSLLLAPVDLQNQDINDDQLVVAIGDNTIIFNIPDRLDYLKDYMNDKPEMPFAIVLKFLASMSINTRAPIYKYIYNIDISQCSLRPDEIDRLQKRIEASKSINSCIDSIPQNSKRTYKSIKEIISLNEKTYKELDIISYNTHHLLKEDVKKYIVEFLENITYGQWCKNMTQLSRLIMIWDFYSNKNRSN